MKSLETALGLKLFARDGNSMFLLRKRLNIRPNLVIALRSALGTERATEQPPAPW